MSEPAMNDKQKVELPVVAWATHHDEPMLFPTEHEASTYCDDDEPPIPLTTVAHAEQYARAMMGELSDHLRGCMEALSHYVPHCIEVECATAVLAKLGDGK